MLGALDAIYTVGDLPANCIKICLIAGSHTQVKYAMFLSPNRDLGLG